MRAPFAPPRLSEPRNVDADAQATDECRTPTAGREDSTLQSRNVLLPDQWVIHRRNSGLCQISVSFGTRGPR